MSEKINELIKSVKDLKYDASTGTFETDRRALFEFAELIVRECAKFLDENSGSDQCNNVWYPTPEEMLQHFGVDE